MSKETSRLIGYVKDKQEALERERQLHKKSPNELMAENTPDIISEYDFWCDECEEDFTSKAYKTVHRLYGDPIVCYHTRHECGEDCIRLVSHRDNDQYYYKSAKIRRQRAEYAVDMLQAGQYGFKTHYGHKGFDEELIKREEKIINEEREKGFKLSYEAINA